ncbi:MAG: hypothetical protein JJU19_09735 [Pararhodobacter sp.]|nr:hypothetical protein [Pararhodobacter sp.]
MSRTIRVALVALVALPTLAGCHHFHHREPEPVIVPVQPVEAEPVHRKYR